VDNTLPIADSDEHIVTVTADGWTDADGIESYNFYFSYDGGDIYIPLEKANPEDNFLSFIFKPVYQAVNTYIKCEAVDTQDFSSFAVSTLTVLMRPGQDEDLDLETVVIDMCEGDLEINCLNDALSINLLAQVHGELNIYPSGIFETLTDPEDCTYSFCGDGEKGTCNFIGERRGYFCDCDPDWAGTNCTYLVEDYTDIQAAAYSLIETYSTKDGTVFVGENPLEFVRLLT
jgi:hypothetical protein